MKKVLGILIVILIIALAVNGNHHRHGRTNYTQVIVSKNDSASVEVGRLLKPYEVANLLVNQL